MQRIRTVKPDLFKHEDLCDGEVETGLPLRLIFAGLFTLCDRAGRFRWRPRSLRAECFPFDTFDMGAALDALVTRGLVVKYASGDEALGCIPTWDRHQYINNRETASIIPEPQPFQVLDTSATRVPHVVHASGTVVVKEGKGKEGNTGASPVARSLKTEAETVYKSYPIQKGKPDALKAIEKTIAELHGEGLADPVDYLTSRIRVAREVNERKTKAGEFVPEMPYPQKWFRQKYYENPEYEPKPKVEFVEVDPAEDHQRWLSRSVGA